MKIASLLSVTLLVLITTSIAFSDSTYREIAVQNGGTIRGTVTLKGTPLEPKVVPVSADTGACGKMKTLSSMIVGPNQGLKNAIVGLQGITQGKKLDRAVHLALDQLKCEYAPHILIVPSGATVDYMNNDAILHNIHAYDLDAKADPQLGAKTIFNIALPVKGMKIPKPMNQSGLVRMLCDAGHPWMNAYLLVTDHPYFAVTDEQGKFTLTDVPPGTYTITMWHEGEAKVEPSTKSYTASDPYRLSQKVTVTPRGTCNVNFTLDLTATTGKSSALR